MKCRQCGAPFSNENGLCPWCEARNAADDKKKGFLNPSPHIYL